MVTVRWKRPDTREMATVRLPNRMYARLLRRFTVEGARRAVPCALCEEAKYDCERCRWPSPCPQTTPGLSLAMRARAAVKEDKPMRGGADAVAALRKFHCWLRRIVVKGASP